VGPPEYKVGVLTTQLLFLVKFTILMLLLLNTSFRHVTCGKQDHETVNLEILTKFILHAPNCGKVVHSFPVATKLFGQ
jgi:hypothetical protein